MHRYIHTLRVRIIILFKVDRQINLWIILVTFLISVVKHLTRCNFTEERLAFAHGLSTHPLRRPVPRPLFQIYPSPTNNNHTNSPTHHAPVDKERMSKHWEKKEKEDLGKTQKCWGDIKSGNPKLPS